MRREERREKLKLTREENETDKELEIIEIDDSSGSTPDEDDFLNMVGEAIKKHNDTILKERKSAERKRILKNRKN
jgi:phosphopantetheine adenylyltransferase